MITRYALPILLALVALDGHAQPSHPQAPPTRNEKTQPQAQQTQATQPQPVPSTRGTDADPLVVRTTRGQSEAAEDQKDTQDQQSNRRWSLTLSAITTVVLGLQVFLLIRQNSMMNQQNTIMDGQRAAADTQSTHMRDALTETRNSIEQGNRSTTAMENIAHSMAANLQLLQDALGTNKQIAETNVALYHAANRGSLSVRPIAVDGFGNMGHIVTDLTNGQIRITNVGAVNITFLRFHVRWLFTLALPVTNPAVRALDTATNATVVKPGHFADIPIDDFKVSPEVFGLLNDNVEAVHAGLDTLLHRNTLYLFGYVKFSDAIGLRRNYFCFQYSPYLRSFAPVKHPQYNYEE